MPVSSRDKKRSISYWFRLCAAFWGFLLVGLYIGAAPIFHQGLFYQLLFAAAKYPSGWVAKDEMNGVKAKDVSFKSSNGKLLHGLFFQRPGARKVVLLHHGKTLNLTYHLYYGSHLLTDDVSLLVYDYEGFGKSEGEPSIAALGRGADAAYTFLLSQGFKPPEIIHCGVSLGTGPAAEVASAHPCGGLILVSPYTSLRTLSSDVIPPLKLYPSFAFPESDIGCLAPVAKLSAPLLIIQGTLDPIIPVQHADELFAVAHCKKTYKRMEGAGHVEANDLAKPEFDSSLKEFIRAI